MSIWYVLQNWSLPNSFFLSRISRMPLSSLVGIPPASTARSLLSMPTDPGSIYLLWSRGMSVDHEAFLVNTKKCSSMISACWNTNGPHRHNPQHMCLTNIQHNLKGCRPHTSISQLNFAKEISSLYKNTPWLATDPKRFDWGSTLWRLRSGNLFSGRLLSRALDLGFRFVFTFNALDESTLLDIYSLQVY